MIKIAKKDWARVIEAVANAHASAPNCGIDAAWNVAIKYAESDVERAMRLMDGAFSIDGARVLNIALREIGLTIKVRSFHKFIEEDGDNEEV